MEFGNRLRLLRKSKNMTLKEFASGIGIDLATVSSYEEGKISPSLKVLFRINEVHRVNMNWLFSGDGEMFLNEEEKTFLENMKKREITHDDLQNLHFLKSCCTDKDLKKLAYSPIYFLLLSRFINIKNYERDELDWLFQLLEALKETETNMCNYLDF